MTKILWGLLREGNIAEKQRYTRDDCTIRYTRKIPGCFAGVEIFTVATAATIKGTIVNRTYGTQKNNIFTYFYPQYVVLFNMVLLYSSWASSSGALYTNPRRKSKH